MCDVSDESRLMKEEVFGPVTCVVPFKTEDEVYMCYHVPSITAVGSCGDTGDGIVVCVVCVGNTSC